MTGSAVQILVVDEPPIRKLLRVGLTAHGYDLCPGAVDLDPSDDDQRETEELK